MFLKWNKNNTVANICLGKWVEIFSDARYQIHLLCDLAENALNIDGAYVKMPKNGIKLTRSSETIRTFLLNTGMTKQWAYAGAAHLTCYLGVPENIDFFWNIDADDTIFLNTDENIREKFKLVENFFVQSDMDCFSLDFWRLLENHWSFGVSIHKPNWSEIAAAVNENIKKYMTSDPSAALKNIDGLFDMMRRTRRLSLESFVLSDCYFQHFHPARDSINTEGFAAGLYFWKDRKIWNKVQIQDDELSF